MLTHQKTLSQPKNANSSTNPTPTTEYTLTKLIITSNCNELKDASHKKLQGYLLGVRACSHGASACSLVSEGEEVATVYTRNSGPQLAQTRPYTIVSEHQQHSLKKSGHYLISLLLCWSQLQPDYRDRSSRMLRPITTNTESQYGLGSAIDASPCIAALMCSWFQTLQLVKEQPPNYIDNKPPVLRAFPVH